MTARVAPVTVDHLGAVAGVHCKAFPDSALTRLGPDLVERYYRWLLTGPHDTVAIGAFAEDRLVGYVVGGRFRRALSGFVHANRAALVRRVATRPWLVANPVVRERLMRARRWVRRRHLPPMGTGAATAANAPMTFGILVVAVAPEARRHGVGRSLLGAAEEAAAAQGVRTLHLTVEPSNAGAIAFYERSGWSRAPDGDAPSGRWTGRMTRQVSPQPGAADPTRS